MARHDVEVWLPVDLEYAAAGRLFVNHQRNSFSTSFEYGAEFIGNPDAYTFDPAFTLRQGTQVHPKGGFSGALSDTQPDRWGKRLISRDRIHRGLPAPTELDYLLAISDELRMGALRYKHLGESEFLAPADSKRIPPIEDVSLLSRLSERAESDEAFDELTRLAEVGGSLGGARPKVNVVDGDGTLSIAKFTSIKDDYSTIAWEYVSLRLAAAAGITTPRSKLLRIGGRPVLILARFDRLRDERGERHRIPYMSAMTLLQMADGGHSSYVEIAEELVSKRDKQELFRRAALGLLIHNTDDHLRNHGLLRGAKGWRLSPVFDLNPGTNKTEHETVISPFGEDGIVTLMDAAPLFALREAEALDALGSVVDSVGRWSEEARRAGISQSEINTFNAVFGNEHFDQAQRIVSTRRGA